MRKLVTALAALVATFVLQSAALSAPSIDAEWNPRIPEHVANPGGLFTADCWVNTDGTVPQELTVQLLSQTDEILFTITIPGETFYHLEYVVPNGLVADGIYRYRVEYVDAAGGVWVVEKDFLIAGAVTGLCAIKFIDNDGNGEYEPAVDDLAEGWEMCADGPGFSECELTDENGLACWFGISDGLYEVCETLQDGYESTTGGVCQDVEVMLDEINKVEFGNWIPPVPTHETTWGNLKGAYR